MRIARILTRLNLGGPARQVLASDPLLADRGHTIRIFTGRPEPGEGELFDRARERGLDVVRVAGLGRGVRPIGDLRAAAGLRRELRAFGPDLVHTHASKAGVLGRRAVRALASEARIARLHTFHGHVLEGYFPERVSRGLRRIERRLAAETDRVLCVSHATADDIVRLEVAPEEKIVVVPPGVELEPLLAIERPSPGESRKAFSEASPRTLVGARPEAILVGVVGRLASVKQPLAALSIFEKVAELHPLAELVFIGDGSERRALEGAVRASRFARRIHLLGARAEMVEVLADLDLVLCASRSEGLPVALIEAAAAQLPVVARDVGGVSEVVPHERTGMLGNTDAELSLMLSSLLADESQRRVMGKRARIRVASRHGAEALADRLEAVYEACLRERRASEGAG
ncbi:MAG TPA: glycosyltransferase family 1 protein [Planctomycetes bacterium]|nr:glycosyltransferase family 1 protein [Planctomycetota bacterium]